MSRWKALPWVLGVALLAVALVAALRLPAPDTAPGGGAVAPAGSAAPTGGLTTVGWVDTTAGILPITPPGVMGMGSLTVKKVHVADGAKVEPGAVLVEFDTGPLLAKKTEAEHAVTAAQWTAALAKKKKDDHPKELKKAALAVEKAEDDEKAAAKYLKIVSDTLNDVLNVATVPGKIDKLSAEEKELRRSRSVELHDAEVKVRQAGQAVKLAKLDEERLKAAPVEEDVQRANVQVAVYEAQAAQAVAAIESYTLKAEVGGVVEQVTVAKGMSVGPATRTPMMYLVPAGPRVVRAEVEAEFAHKIDGFVGKPVTIRAGHNFNDTYPGVAGRVSGAFLNKRFGGDALGVPSTRALECTIEIPDPAPAGKPPLRPGQPVWVVFGP